MQLTAVSSSYIQPSSTESMKSPLEMLANTCNKLETEMLSSKPSPFLPESRNPPSPPTRSLLPSPSQSISPGSSAPYRGAVSTVPMYTPAPTSHLPVRTAPTRSSLDALPLQKVSPRASPLGSIYASTSLKLEPLSLVSSSRISPSSSQPQPPKDLKAPKRPEIGALKVKSAESLSPRTSSPKNSSSPYSSSSPKLPASSPRLSNSSPRPPSGLSGPFPGLPGLPMSSYGLTAHLYGQPVTSMAGLQALQYSQYLAQGSAPPPCTDPLCRDPSCPTFALRSAQAQYLSQSLGYGYPGIPVSLPLGYPSPYPMLQPGFPGFPGLPYTPPYLQGLPQATQEAPGAPPPSTSAPTGSSPFSCNWMQGKEFCGRRFNSSEELMGHLRSHTSPIHAPTSSSALAVLQAQAAALRSQPSPSQGSPRSNSRSTPSASPPTSESRYHPYSRSPAGPPPPHHPSLPPHLTTLPPHLSSLPPHLSQTLPPHFAGLPPHPSGLPAHLLSSLYGAPRPILPVLP